MSKVERNVYTENIHLRGRFNSIYQMIKEHKFVHENDVPTALGLRHPMIMEIFRIAKKEREEERVIRLKT